MMTNAGSYQADSVSSAAVLIVLVIVLVLLVRHFSARQNGTDKSDSRGGYIGNNDDSPAEDDLDWIEDVLDDFEDFDEMDDDDD